MAEQNQGQALSQKGGSGWIVVVIIIILLVAGGVYAYNRKSSNNKNQEQAEIQDVDNDGDESAGMTPTTSQPSPVVGTSTTDSAGVKVFTLNASNFSFSPNEIKVKKGDKVKIVMNNTGGFHDWVVDEFNARTERVTGPATASVEFTADKAGTFEFYCSVGQHRQMGMKGNLVVE